MIRNSAAIGLVALAAGLLAQFLFVEAGFGINVFVATVALLMAGWLVRDRTRPAPRLLDSWLAPGALILAAFVALRGDVTLVTLDVLGAIALSGAALATFSGLRVLEKPLGALAAVAGRLAASAVVAGARPVAALWRALPSMRGRARTGKVAPVVRGLVIAIPLVLIFVALFSSADAVFARITGTSLTGTLSSARSSSASSLPASWPGLPRASSGSWPRGRSQRPVRPATPHRLDSASAQPRR